MPRPRKVPLTPTADPEILAASLLDAVKDVLRDAGITIPLSTWVACQQAAIELLPNKQSNPSPTITTNGAASHD
jgi:hypothetical protein